MWKAAARGLAILRGLKAHRSYCAKHNQHAKHAKAKGFRGHAPKKF